MFVAALATGCPSGSSSSSAGGGSEPLPETLGIAGAISVLAPVAENEPNNELDTAQVLGELQPGGSVTIVGEIGDGSDTLDSFRLSASTRVKIVATLHFNVGAGSADQDFDLCVYSTVGQQVVDSFESTSVPETGSFEAQGSFFIVVSPFAGDGVYSLTLDAVPITGSIAEREDNNEHGTAQYLGEVSSGDVITVDGSARLSSDANDRFLIAMPAAVSLDFSLAFTANGVRDLDIHLYDATASVLAPIFETSFNGGPLVSPEVGTFPVGAMTLLEVEVEAAAGVADYSLSITANDLAPMPSHEGMGGPLVTGRIAAASLAKSRSRSLTGFGFGTPRHTDQVFGELIVKPRAGRDVSALLEQRSMRVLGKMPSGPIRVGFEMPHGLTRVDKARHTLAVTYSLDACKDVEWSIPNQYFQACQTTPDDVLYPLQWHYAQIGLPAAWDLTVGDNDVIVAVLDTGEVAHPDLTARRIDGVDMISDADNAADGDGVDNDPTDVGDNSDGHAGPGPSSFHGTHVAGTIGATTDNVEGVAGVTWATRIMHVRVLGLEGGSNWDIAQGILYSAGLENDSGLLPAEAADVINMSLGGPGDPDLPSVVQDAIDDAFDAGLVIVAAAGNNNSSEAFTPAAFENVISVSAVDLASAKAPYSNFHETVDIAAPGGDVSADLNGDGQPDGVLSTIRQDNVSPPQDVYGFYQGTSMAAPHVAGVAALMLAIDPDLTPGQIESFLTQTATDLGAPGRDDIFGHGLVNAFAAVSLAQDGAPTVPVLGLSAQAAVFDSNDTSSSIGISNFGAGVLSVNDPTAATDDSGAWLSAERVAESPVVDSDTSHIEIEIDRSGLDDGTYSGSVSVATNGGNATINVTMIVSSVTTGASLDIFVLAIDPVSFDTIAEATLNTTGALSYSFTNLPAGEYIVVAGSDVDQDNFICDDGEPFCGIYPSLDQPGLLVLEEDADALTGIDFPVQSVFTALSSSPKSGFRRLDQD
ncbi:MAG: serine protease [Planctomycetota bacterium]|jgi:serine protease